MPDPVLNARALKDDRWERSRRVGLFDPDVTATKRALVVGAGALGNEVVKNLVLSGVQRITLVDMDRIELSNLNRCVFFTPDDASGERYKAEVVAQGARRLAPETRFEVITRPVEEEGERVFRAADVVIGCVDNIAARLHLNAQARYYGVPYVDGGIRGLRGKVQVSWKPEDPCLECSVNASHRKVLDVRFSCTGNDVTVFTPKVAAEITTTSIISAVEVREALKALHGLEETRLRGILYYDGHQGTMEALETERNPRCPHHENRKRTEG